MGQRVNSHFVKKNISTPYIEPAFLFQEYLIILTWHPVGLSQHPIFSRASDKNDFIIVFSVCQRSKFAGVGAVELQGLRHKSPALSGWFVIWEAEIRPEKWRSLHLRAARKQTRTEY